MSETPTHAHAETTDDVVADSFTARVPGLYAAHPPKPANNTKPLRISGRSIPWASIGILTITGGATLLYGKTVNEMVLNTLGATNNSGPHNTAYYGMVMYAPSPTNPTRITHGDDIIEHLTLTGRYTRADLGPLKVELVCTPPNGTQKTITTTPNATLSVKGNTTDVSVTVPGAAKYMKEHPSENCVIKDSATPLTSYSTANSSHSDSTHVGAGIAAVSLTLTGVMYLYRRRRRNARRRVDIQDLIARWGAAQERHDALSADYLSYDKNWEKLLAAPAMRDMSYQPTVDAVEAMVAADNIAATIPDPANKQARSKLTPQHVAAFEDAVTAFDVSLAIATQSAHDLVKNGLTGHERDLLTRAQNSLRIALDPATTPGERTNALRVVDAVMRRLNIHIDPKTQVEVRAAIEQGAPLALLNPTPRHVNSTDLSRLDSITVDSILDDLLPLTDRISREAVIRLKVRRLGETEVNALTEATRAAAMHATNARPAPLSARVADQVRIESLRGRVRQARGILTSLVAHQATPDDVRDAATQRVQELADILNATHTQPTAIARNVPVTDSAREVAPQ